MATHVSALFPTINRDTRPIVHRVRPSETPGELPQAVLDLIDNKVFLPRHRRLQREHGDKVLLKLAEMAQTKGRPSHWYAKVTSVAQWETTLKDGAPTHVHRSPRPGGRRQARGRSSVSRLVHQASPSPHRGRDRRLGRTRAQGVEPAEIVRVALYKSSARSVVPLPFHVVLLNALTSMATLIIPHTMPTGIPAVLSMPRPSPKNDHSPYANMMTAEISKKPWEDSGLPGV